MEAGGLVVPPPYGDRVEVVAYPNESEEFDLAGTLTLPEGKGPFPGVIQLAGSGR